MTVREQAQLIGRTGFIRYGSTSMTIEVTVTDVKEAYGKTRVRVEPIVGTGHAWVELTTVTLYPRVEVTA